MIFIFHVITLDNTTAFEFSTGVIRLKLAAFFGAYGKDAREVDFSAPTLSIPDNVGSFPNS